VTDNSGKGGNHPKGDLIDDLIDALDGWDIERQAPATTPQGTPVETHDTGSAPAQEQTSISPFLVAEHDPDTLGPSSSEESTRLIDLSHDPAYHDLVASMRGPEHASTEGAFDTPGVAEPAAPTGEEGSFHSMDTPTKAVPWDELHEDSGDTHQLIAELTQEEEEELRSVEDTLSAPLALDLRGEGAHSSTSGRDDLSEEPHREAAGELEAQLEPVPTTLDIVPPDARAGREVVIDATDDQVVEEVPAVPTEESPVAEYLPRGLTTVLDRLGPRAGRALEIPMRALPPLDTLLDRVTTFHPPPSPFQVPVESLASRAEVAAEHGDDVREAVGCLCEAARIRERRLGEPARARELYSLALQLDPGLPVALSGRRRMAVRLGQMDGLGEQIDAELSLPLGKDERLELLLLKAEWLLARATDSGAVEVYREAASLAPDDVRPIIALAAFAQRDGEMAWLAALMVELAGKVPPGALRVAAQAIAGDLHESLGATDAALACYDEAASHGGTWPSVLAGLVRTAMRAGRPEVAIEGMQRLAASLGSGPAVDALRRRAAALSSARGNPGTALELLATPADRHQWAVVRDAALACDRSDTASQALAEVASRSTDPVVRCSTFIDLVLRGGARELDAIRTALDEMLERDPNNPMIISVRAELARCGEETAELVRLEAGSDASAAGMFRAALALDRRGRADDARSWIERARSLPGSRTEAELAQAVLAAASSDWRGLAEILHRAEGGIGSALLRAGVLLHLGQIHELRLGDGIGARAGYARALEVERGFIPALSGLARTGADPSARHQAARRLAEACQGSYAALDRLVVAGHLAEEAGASAAALESYTDALSLDPAHPTALLGAERILRRTGGTDELVGVWNRASEARRQGVAAFLLGAAARAVSMARSDDDLAEILARALEHCPGDPTTADTLIGLPRTSGRAGWLEGALSIVPTSMRVAELVRSAERSEPDEPGRSLDWYTHALSLEPGRIDAVQGRGRAMVMIGRADELEEELRARLAAAQSEPEIRTIQDEFIDLAGQRGDASAETSRREERLGTSPSDLSNLRWLASKYRADRRWADLARVFDELSHTIEDPGTAAGAAAMAVRLQSLDEAHPFGTLETAKHAVSLQPQDVRALLNLYQAAQHTGSNEARLEAASGLARHLGLPRCRSVYELRAADALVRLGKLEEAQAALVRAGEDGGHPLGWWHASRLSEQRGDAAFAARAAEVSGRMAHDPRHQTAEYLRAGRLWLEKVGDASAAILALRHVLEIDPSCEEALELSHLAMTTDGVEPRIALEVIVRRLGSPRPREEVIDLGTRGATIALGLGDLEAAKHLLQTVLSVDPDHLDSLTRLTEICRTTGSWEEAASCLVRLAQLARTPREIEAHHLALGTIAREHLHDSKQAIQAFQRVLASSPDNLDALRQLAVLLPEERLWRAAAEVNAKLGDLEPDVRGQRDALLRLARVYEVGLNTPMRAQMALDEARRRDPTDLTTMGALVQYFKRQGQEQALRVHLDLAASEYRKILGTNPCDTSAYHAIYQVHAWQGRLDSARLAAAVLTTFGQASEEEQHLLSQAGGMGWQPGPAVADTRLDEHLSPFSVSATLRTLFSHVGESLLRLAPQAPRTFGVGRSDRLGRGHPVYELALGMATWYGLREVEVYAHPSDATHWSLFDAGTPALVLGHGLLDRAEPGELRFLIGRGMAIHQRKLTILHQLEPRKVTHLLPAVVKTVAPNFEMENVDEALLAELVREVNKALPKKIRAEIGPFAFECLGGLQDETSNLSRHLVEFADRAGLLAAGGLRPAISALRRFQGLPPLMSPDQRLECISSDARSGALLIFFVSPEHAAVREKLGLAFPI